MSHSPRPNDGRVLSETLTKAVLTRASEIDVALRAGATVSELRAAAQSAGISDEAFDTALAETQGLELATALATRRKTGAVPRGWVLIVAAAIVTAVGAATMTARNAPGGPALVQEAILLRCLTPGQAADLARPHVSRSSRITMNPTTAPGVLTLEGTAEDIRKVRSVLEPYERSGLSCPR